MRDHHVVCRTIYESGRNRVFGLLGKLGKLGNVSNEKLNAQMPQARDLPSCSSYSLKTLVDLGDTAPLTDQLCRLVSGEVHNS